VDHREGLEPRGVDAREGRLNFLLGPDPAGWHTGVRRFERVRYDEVWPGIDLLLRQGEGLFAYDLELGPEADLRQAVIAVSGAEGLDVDGGGNLVLRTSAGELVHSAPVAWTRDREGRRLPHPIAFRLLGDERFGFAGPPVPAGTSLVVDPGVRWSTLVGHEDHDIARDVARTSSGEVLVTGTTLSFDFPTDVGAYDGSWNGNYDAFVMRFSADGSTLVFGTFVGGAGGDSGTGVAVAEDGSVYVGGDTSSPGFPVTAGAYDTSFAGVLDAFVLRLDATGSQLLASSLLGGNLIERATDLELDAEGRPLICGGTASSSFPAIGGYDTTFGGGGGDAFVVRLSADLGSLDFGSFLGAEGNDGAEALEIGADGRITLGGWTRSEDFPVTSGVVDRFLTGTGSAQDGFVSRLSAGGGSLVWSTYLGGAEHEAVLDLAVDESGGVFAVGETESSDFPLDAAPQQDQLGGGTDAFVTRLSPAADALLSSTYFGGGADDQALAVTRLANGSHVVVGTTGSDDLDYPPWSYDSHFGTFASGGLSDVFINRYDAAGDMDYGSYLGGRGEERALAVVGDGAGGVLLCGEMNSFDFPTTAGAFDVIYDLTTIPDGFLTSFEFLRFPFQYGEPKINSLGGWANLSTTGFPSLTEGGFTIWVDGAYYNTTGLFFWSEAPGELPLAGGLLHMRGPFHRTPVVQVGIFGSASLEVEVDPAMVGRTRYYQFWYEDGGDPWGVGLSAGLEVVFYP